MDEDEIPWTMRVRIPETMYHELLKTGLFHARVGGGHEFDVERADPNGFAGRAWLFFEDKGGERRFFYATDLD